jgi:regulator of protease activity HflC (stomatin/prohibitin superfamily)
MFKKFIAALVIAASVALSAGCTRIETGEVGLRVDFNKQVQGTELMEGSWNQTLVGDVLTFPTRQVGIEVNDRRPLTSDNSTLADFDATVIYSVNPASVSELWGKKSRAFHKYDEKRGDWLLMERRVETFANNAIYKVARKYEALKIADARQSMEGEIKNAILEELKLEKLDTSILIDGVQIRNVRAAPDIVASANRVIQLSNELKAKEKETLIAEQEANRMRALSANAEKSIAYMDAEARRNISLAILGGKVNTIVIPNDFKGIVNVK